MNVFNIKNDTFYLAIYDFLCRFLRPFLQKQEMMPDFTLIFLIFNPLKNFFLPKKEADFASLPFMIPFFSPL